MKNKTLKEILENPQIKDIAPDAIRGWDLSKEDFYNETLAELAISQNWNNLERGFSRLFEISSNGDYYYKLYTDEESSGNHEKETANIVFFPSEDKSACDKPFIFLICGGAFVNVWNLTEGWPVAKCFNDLSYNVFLLSYQVGIEGTAVNAMTDIARAMEIIKKNKDKFNVNPNSYITCGFSAGGYIACLWNTEVGYRAFDLPKPEACFPVYPVTSFRLLCNEDVDDGNDMDCFACSCTGIKLHEACKKCFEIPEHVEGFPRTAIFVAAEDDLVNPEHSKNLARALEKAGIPCRLEIGKEGGHGFSDGLGMCMEGWPERAIKWYENEN